MTTPSVPGENAVIPIGVVRSTLTSRENAPRQGDEGAPDAWLEMAANAVPGLSGLSVGDELIILTWLHQADRATLEVHPRGNTDRPLTGVFATRSPDRPNPIGLHKVNLLEIQGDRLHVVPLEAIDGTPILDIKPVLGAISRFWVPSTNGDSHSRAAISPLKRHTCTRILLCFLDTRRACHP